MDATENLYLSKYPQSALVNAKVSSQKKKKK